jgi:hypothetical protein
MRFVGKFGEASARQLTASAYVLGALACSVNQPVSGPVSLTAEWKTIDPPAPLKVGGKLEQRLCLDVGTMQDVDFDKGVVVLGNGQRHTLAGEVVDDQQTTYPLKVASQGKTLCLHRAERTAPEPDFPADRTIAKVRLRSEPPLQVAEIRWHSYDPH